ncbi:hypothetical protein I552_2268 [Mycobacterium xenopi 3993]|nr:hypothetical protein I552_2268 [Mycobacterium xenopi 3993]
MAAAATQPVASWCITGAPQFLGLSHQSLGEPEMLRFALPGYPKNLSKFASLIGWAVLRFAAARRAANRALILSRSAREPESNSSASAASADAISMRRRSPASPKVNRSWSSSLTFSRGEGGG